MNRPLNTKTYWIANPLIETIFIIAPPFLCLLAIFLFPQTFILQNTMPDLWWLILVVFIDVAHVYSTLYRTYFLKKDTFKYKKLLYSIPLGSFFVSFAIYSYSPMLFWRLLAYVAVFHFIRQQYGFMRIYTRKELQVKWYHKFDNYIIYLATLYPILYWHLSDNRMFHWFVKDDFIQLNFPILLKVSSIIYFLSIGIYFLIESYRLFVKKDFNLAKTLIVLGTILSWYFGIIYFNGDMTFTLLNVVSHGIPYMALVWLHTKNGVTIEKSKLLKTISKPYGILVFLLIICLFAFVEEGFWDSLVWGEHKFFFTSIPNFSLPNSAIPFIVALLTVPQITHYIIDGYIWKGPSKIPAQNGEN